ncbi:hypothetical protein NP493_625g01113 [Ridgeia piscesae]|uniref:Uncharacterized protein n=1 Tax=Ridgeia piscesae TaxID=27915 RepID=A0AAD9KT72_RIDPI|nr:hypothetical protein NP493_625g01113 [Ridgeia piscesae]
MTSQICIGYVSFNIYYVLCGVCMCKIVMTVLY